MGMPVAEAKQRIDSREFTRWKAWLTLDRADSGDDEEAILEIFKRKAK